MRPHKLTMKAFGVFAEETVIPFDEMGNEVYLVAGDTGAGKTTIFDALVYALFGTASGSGRSKLNTEEFYSDFYRNEETKPEMLVELSFSNAGRMFTVHRTMNWGKKGKAAKSDKNSYLEENGRTIATGKGSEEKDDVSRKIREILGIDADQFRKIVMLAQGEFQQFLFAGADVRGEILGQLYKNERQQDLENRLQAADKRLRELEKSLSDKAAEKLAGFVCPEQLTGETAAALNIDHTGLEKVMSDIISGMQQEHGIVKQEMETCNGNEKTLIAARAAGETDNKLLDNLKTSRERLAALEQGRPANDALREKHDRAVRAELVLADETAMLKAQKNLAVTEAGIKDVHRKTEDKKQAEQRLRAELENTKTRLEPENKKLEKELTRLNDSLALYTALESRQKVLSDKRREEQSAGERLTTAKSEIQKQKVKIAGLETLLAELSDAGDAAISVAENVLNQYKAKNTELTGLRDAIRSRSTLENEITKLTGEWHNLQKDAVSAEETHLKLQKAFLSGQAGVLADELREKILSEGSSACPVCGAVHTAAGINGLAVHAGTVPKEEDVTAALELMNKKNSAANAKGNQLTAKRTELSGIGDKIKDKLMNYPEFGSADMIPDEQHIKRIQNECLADISAAEQELIKQRGRKTERLKAEKDKSALNKAAEAAEKEITGLTEAQNAAAVERAAAEAELSVIKEQLNGYPEDRKAARELINALQKTINGNSEIIAGAEQAWKNCTGEIENLSGQLDTLRTTLEDQKAAADEAEKIYAAGISDQGFEDEYDYEDAASPEGRKYDKWSLHSWIELTAEKIKKYELSYNEAKNEVDTLSKNTEGKEYVDLLIIEKAIAEEQEQQKKLDERKRRLDNSLNSNENIRSEVLALLKKRARIIKVRKSVKPMADAANGRLPFSRYVLGGFYRDIVERANIHLGEMTGGEYSLRAKADGDKRSALGLNLTVENAFTGTERKAETLSGGQTFEASLSLALGLSEVAQLQSTAAVQIDSLFIDEGFGSLDDFRLEKAIGVLKNISADKRQIGIISHVARLDQELPKKLKVTSSKKGSRVTVISDV